MIPDYVIRIRQGLCRAAKCTHNVNYADPCIACPAGHFGPLTKCSPEEARAGAASASPARTRIRRGPGDHVEALIERVTGVKAKATCGCESMIKQMNAWGWIGCWKNRQQILKHLVGKARTLGHPRLTGKRPWLELLGALLIERGRL